MIAISHCLKFAPPRVAVQRLVLKCASLHAIASASSNCECRVLVPELADRPYYADKSLVAAEKRIPRKITVVGVVDTPATWASIFLSGDRARLSMQ